MVDSQSLFLRYLTQLKKIVQKVPDELFSSSLSEDMFSLEMHAKIAANFTLRGYCPLNGIEPVSLFEDQSGKAPVLKQIQATLDMLGEASIHQQFDDSNMLVDKAGFAEVKLKESEFIHCYIVPNILFHISMVYAIARANGVPLSKGDFDGLHSYPAGFSWVK
ncbi:hypothetical protein TW81_16155 [Vibrio galatheae]|uniref:DUF1993 domain-containing protein n=1 Tax=Vibrio galatheae TaxID=579748 RepID=A0A0F4NG90_9VIBR|nr:DUF1993 family protein [Vibrio galatheae]KJY81883.1 hypothetical protein TW81_16155 [Vibrio galatheae]